MKSLKNNLADDTIEIHNKPTNLTCKASTPEDMNERFMTLEKKTKKSEIFGNCVEF